MKFCEKNFCKKLLTEFFFFKFLKKFLTWFMKLIFSCGQRDSMSHCVGPPVGWSGGQSVHHLLFWHFRYFVSGFCIMAPAQLQATAAVMYTASPTSPALHSCPTPATYVVFTALLIFETDFFLILFQNNFLRKFFSKNFSKIFFQKDFFWKFFFTFEQHKDRKQRKTGEKTVASVLAAWRTPFFGQRPQ